VGSGERLDTDGMVVRFFYDTKEMETAQAYTFEKEIEKEDSDR
jgi:hypothetical protein